MNSSECLKKLDEMLDIAESIYLGYRAGTKFHDGLYKMRLELVELKQYAAKQKVYEEHKNV